MEKQIIGSEEWLSLPELDLPAVKARIDSGAKTSSLHAYNIYPFIENGKEMVRFDVHPIQKNRRVIKRCVAEMVDHRVVRSSNAEEEKRIVIRTPVKIGDKTWNIEVTLTNRDAMGYRMLLGREAMKDRILVDPAQSCTTKQLADDDALGLYKVNKKSQKVLRIGLLASNPNLYSNRRIMEAAQSKGHEIQFIDISQCYMNVHAKHGKIHYRGGQSLMNLDAVIPRIRPSMTFYGCALLRQFELIGTYCLNEADTIARSRDKLRSLQSMSRKGIDMPATGFAGSPYVTKDLIEMVGGAPLIIKLLEGTQGTGVILAETNKTAESVISAFKSIKANILVQAFVKEANGSDLRAFVIGSKVVGAMERQAPPGEFRANVHLGATVKPAKLSTAEKKIAVAAAKAMGLAVSGVDLIRSNTGAKVLEVNSSPGLQGIESATGLDIAGLMIDAIEEKLV